MQQSWKTACHHTQISVAYLYTCNKQFESKLIK